jgi:hypothetical protein
MYPTSWLTHFIMDEKINRLWTCLDFQVTNMIWNYFPLYYISHNVVTGTKKICFVDQCYVQQNLISTRTWQTHPNDFHCIPRARHVVFSSVHLCCCIVKYAHFGDIRLQRAIAAWNNSKKCATKGVRTSWSLLSTAGIWYSDLDRGGFL